MEHDFHRELKRLTADYFESNGWTVFQEFALPDRTIADIFAYRKDSGFVIAEAATIYSASKAERTFGKYYKWCNKLYLVTADEMMLSFGEGKKLINWINKQQEIGMLFTKGGRMIVMRPATSHNLDVHDTNQLWDRMDRSSTSGMRRVLTEAK